MTLTSRELEREVARMNPQELTRERQRYVKEDRLKLTFGISEDLHRKLKRVRDLEAQRTSKPISIEMTLEALVDFYLERKDPVRRAERVLDKRQRSRRLGDAAQSLSEPERQSSMETAGQLSPRAGRQLVTGTVGEHSGVKVERSGHSTKIRTRPPVPAARPRISALLKHPPFVASPEFLTICPSSWQRQSGVSLNL